MHTDKSKVMFSDYCRLSELRECRLKLKAQLFSTFCKMAKEGEKYIFTYWYSVVPLSNSSNSAQVSINAIIKDRHTDPEDIISRIIPFTQKTLFSTFSGLFKIGKNHSKKIIGEKKMIVKCPRCGSVVPFATDKETTLLKDEIKNKDTIIENLRKDNEELMKTIEELQKKIPSNNEGLPELEQMEEPKVEEVEQLPEQPEEILPSIEENQPETIRPEIISELPVEEAKEELSQESVEEEKPLEEIPVEEETKAEESEDLKVEEQTIEPELQPEQPEQPEIEEIHEEKEEESVAEMPEENIPSEELPTEENIEMVEEPILKEEAIEEQHDEEPLEEKEEQPKEEIPAMEDPYNIHKIPTIRI